MESVRDERTPFVMSNSLLMAVNAGATIEEETGEMNVKDETRGLLADSKRKVLNGHLPTRVAAHFL